MFAALAREYIHHSQQRTMGKAVWDSCLLSHSQLPQPQLPIPCDTHHGPGVGPSSRANHRDISPKSIVALELMLPGGDTVCCFVSIMSGDQMFLLLVVWKQVILNLATDTYLSTADDVDSAPFINRSGSYTVDVTHSDREYRQPGPALLDPGPGLSLVSVAWSEFPRCASCYGLPSVPPRPWPHTAQVCGECVLGTSSCRIDHTFHQTLRRNRQPGSDHGR